MNLRKIIFCVFSFLPWLVPVFASDFKLADVFSDYMVWQREQPVEVWGRARPGVSVQLSFGGERVSTQADADGNWKASFPSMSARSEGADLLVESGEEKKVIRDVLIGDVWLCGGQSNMVRELKMTTDGSEVAAQADLPQIRLLKVQQQLGQHPKESITGAWVICSPRTAGDFSAVAFYFARAIASKEKVPIGLIVSAVGGTPVEAWMPTTEFPQIGSLAPHAQERFVKAQSLSETDAIQIAESVARWKADREKVEDPAPGLRQGWHTGQGGGEGSQEVDLPASWERVKPEDVDGAIWFSRDFDVKDVSGDLLALGITRNRPRVWLNGQELFGAKGYEGGTRSVFAIPPDLLRSGRNHVAVRLIIAGGKGGIQESDRPLGIYSVRVGGTPGTSLAGKWHCRVEQALPVERTPVTSAWDDKTTPGILYNGMIAPLVPYAIRGVLWYQGEANVPRPEEYKILFPRLIESWREAWDRPELPFLFVQLAGFQKPSSSPGESTWASLRAAQESGLQLPHTAMVIAYDEGDPHDIHPRNKKPVGERLAQAAESVVYGRKTPAEAFSPRLHQIEREGETLVLTFDPSVSLRTSDGSDEVRGVAIAGDDRKFSWAAARVNGERLVVQAPPETRWVRFAWANFPQVNLVSAAGLPVAPFEREIGAKGTGQTITK